SSITNEVSILILSWWQAGRYAPDIVSGGMHRDERAQAVVTKDQHHGLAVLGDNKCAPTTNDRNHSASCPLPEPFRRTPDRREAGNIARIEPCFNRGSICFSYQG